MAEQITRERLEELIELSRQWGCIDNQMLLTELLARRNAEALPPYLQMAAGNHSIGIFKDGKLLAADADVFEPPGCPTPGAQDAKANADYPGEPETTERRKGPSVRFSNECTALPSWYGKRKGETGPATRQPPAEQRLPIIDMETATNITPPAEQRSGREAYVDGNYIDSIGDWHFDRRNHRKTGTRADRAEDQQNRSAAATGREIMPPATGSNPPHPGSDRASPAADLPERQEHKRGWPTPFTNCRFTFCDLSGQCIREGKCHHPRQPEASTLGSVVNDPKNWNTTDWNKPETSAAEGTPREFYVIFDGPPSHESGRFVEVELANGTGISVGQWTQCGGPYWRLGPFCEASELAAALAERDKWSQEAQWMRAERDRARELLKRAKLALPVMATMLGVVKLDSRQIAVDLLDDINAHLAGDGGGNG